MSATQTAIPVTPGFGASIATKVAGGAHHQRVVSHADRAVASATPVLTAGRTYQIGTNVGPELLLQNAVRFAGDVVLVEEVRVIIRGSLAAAGFMLVVYSTPPTTANPDGSTFALDPVAMSTVAAVIPVRQTDFVSVAGGLFASVRIPATLSATSDAATIRAQLVATTVFTPPAADSVVVTVATVRG